MYLILYTVDKKPAAVICICCTVLLKFVDSRVWICLLCKLPFRDCKSYEIHWQSKHSTPGSGDDHSCAHCGRRFRQTRQLQLHKCRPENYASNIQKEMRQQNRHSCSVQYVGPTFVKVLRHDDILAVVGDIFSHSDNVEDDECAADIQSTDNGQLTDS